MIDPLKRKCKTPYENQGLELFKTYSSKACTLECHLTEAVHHCGCTPWNYPQIEGSLMCDALGIHCFEKVLGQMVQTQAVIAQIIVMKLFIPSLDLQRL